MDLHAINVSHLVEINRASRGELQDALAAAWGGRDEADIDIQVAFERGVYTLQIAGLVGDAVVYEGVVRIRGDRPLPDVQRTALLLLWIDTIQKRVGRSLARADAAEKRRSPTA